MELVRILVVPALLGLGVTRLLGLRLETDRLAHPAWVWMAGTFAAMWVQFLLLWAGLPNAWVLDLVLVLLGAACFVVGGRVVPFRATPAVPTVTGSASGLSRGERFFRAAVVASLLVTLLRIVTASAYAIFRGDEAIYWSFHGKVLFHHGGFGEAYGRVASQFVPNSEYPLFNPLLHVWTFLHAGEITHVLNRVPFQVFSLALVMLFASIVRRVARPSIAAVLVLLLPALPEAVVWPAAAHSEVLVALGSLLMLDAYLRWNADGQRWHLLGAFGAAFALWAKVEGLLFVIAAAVPAGLWLGWELVRGRWRPRGVHLALLAPLAVVAVNLWFRGHFELTSPLTGAAGRTGVAQGIVQLMEERFSVVAAFFVRHVVFSPEDFALVFGIGALLLVWTRAGWRRPLWIPSVSLVIFLTGVFFAFIGRSGSIAVHLDNGVQRVAFECVPALLVLVAFAAERALAGSAPIPALRRFAPALVLVLFAWFSTYAVYRTSRWLLRPGRVAQLQGGILDSENERLVRRLDALDRLERAPTGFHATLHRALLQHTPEDAQVFAVTGAQESLYYPLSCFGMLIYPRAIQARRVLPEKSRWPRNERVFVVSVDEDHAAPLGTFYDEVAAGPGWRLWH